MTKRLVQALTLAAVVGFAAPVTAEASTITITQADPVAHFKFGTGVNQFDFHIEFVGVSADFDLTVTATANNAPSLPPGYVCIPIQGGTNCIMFTASATPAQNFSSYTLTISWQFNTDPLFPNTPVDQNLLGLVRILHFDSTGTEDVTLPNTYCSTCGPDPAIGGAADNFSEFMVVQQQAVPEPSTLVLLASGIVAVGMRLRRRKG